MKQNLNKTIEIFTKVRDTNPDGSFCEWYTKSYHKGVVLQDEKSFYCQCDTYRVPVYEDNSAEEEFGISTKYVITF